MEPIFHNGNGDGCKPSNYRPISIACICCKVMEHVIASSIMNHSEHNDSMASEIKFQVKHNLYSLYTTSQITRTSNEYSKNGYSP